jgi:hypothetical protein
MWGYHTHIQRSILERKVYLPSYLSIALPTALPTALIEDVALPIRLRDHKNSVPFYLISMG